MKILLFALRRSGGSYVSQLLSGGLSIWNEPPLPSVKESLTENIRRVMDLHRCASEHQVIKVCDYREYLEVLRDRSLTIPDGFEPYILFRNPIDQIASHLFTFCAWADPWAPREQFWEAVSAYQNHFDSALEIQRRMPAKILLYEDAVGDFYAPFIKSVYGDDAANFLPYAESVKNTHFNLGPHSNAGTWFPAGERLLKKERAWIEQRLEIPMRVLGYGS